VPTGDESYRTSSRPARPISSRSIAPAEGTPSTSAIPSATTSATTSAILHHQDSHALAASSAPSLSPTIAIGFWTVGTSLTPLPPPRAADGGAVLRPLPIFAMRRGTYAFRVNCAVTALALDVVINSLHDTIHYSRGTISDLGVIGLVLFSSVVRITFEGFFLGIIFQTAHARLGRHSDLWADFGVSLKCQGACFFTQLVVRLLGMIRHFQRLTFGPDYWSNPGKSIIDSAVIYTTGTVIYYMLLIMFYVSSIDTIRRLARPSYYLHPEQARGRPDYCRSLAS